MIKKNSNQKQLGGFYFHLQIIVHWGRISGQKLKQNLKIETKKRLERMQFAGLLTDSCLQPRTMCLRMLLSTVGETFLDQRLRAIND